MAAERNVPEKQNHLLPCTPLCFETDALAQGGTVCEQGSNLLSVNLLLNGAARDEAMHHHASRLPNSVRPVHSLRICGWVPARVKDDDTVGPRERKPNAAHLCCEQHAEDGLILVELVHNSLPLVHAADGPVKPRVSEPSRKRGS